MFRSPCSRWLEHHQPCFSITITMVGSQLLQGVDDECARLQESYFVIRQSVAGLRLSRWHLTRLLAAQIWRDLPPVTATVLVGTAVFVLAWAVSKLFFTSYGPSLEGLGIPLMGQSEGGKMDFRQMMENNAKKVQFLSHNFDHVCADMRDVCSFRAALTESERLGPSTSYFRQSSSTRSSVYRSSKHQCWSMPAMRFTPTGRACLATATP